MKDQENQGLYASELGDGSILSQPGQGVPVPHESNDPGLRIEILDSVLEPDLPV
jgi:hypothetical protein